MPGTAADYSDAAAEEQFKAGVAAALDTDPASITNFLATDSPQSHCGQGFDIPTRHTHHIDKAASDILSSYAVVGLEDSSA